MCRTRRSGIHRDNRRTGMSRLCLAFVLLFAACTASPKPDEALDAAERALRRGEFGEAETLVQRALSTAPGGSPTYWDFRLLLADVLLTQRRIADARAILNEAMPSDAALTPLRAQQAYLQARLAA